MRKDKVSEVFIAFISLVGIFELFDNDRLLVLDHLSLVIFGLLTPITVVSLFNTMWKQRIPVDKRDHIRVGGLLVLFILQYVISNLNDEEKEYIWKIPKAVGFGSMAYLVLGDK